MKKTKPVLYVAIKCVLSECKERKSLMPITWLFRNMFYPSAAENADYYMGTIQQYVRYCRRMDVGMNFSDVC